MPSVSIPSQLHSYTGGAKVVEVEGRSLAEVVAGLDARFPGLKFRVVDEQDEIRQHVRFFVGSEMASSLAHPVGPGDVVKIVGALSGG
jgi:molybdopterin converting factor small subunit